ncbi:hypothetical protein PFISCL1PPCAC_661, partial [Pristionchus fissidentatus]
FGAVTRLGDMSIIDGYATFVALYSALFMFFPLMIVRQWVVRKSAEGFSVMSFLLINFMMACWVKFSYMNGDSRQLYSYGFGLSMMTMYTAVFGYYTKDKKMFVVQIAALVGILSAIHAYVEALPADLRIPTMGKIAAVSQTAMVGGPFFQARDVIGKGTSEFLSFGFTLLTLTMVGNRFLLGLLQGNTTVALGFLPGLAMNLATLSLFYFYPPLTWRVPIIGTGPKETKKKD